MNPQSPAGTGKYASRDTVLSDFVSLRLCGIPHKTPEFVRRAIVMVRSANQRFLIDKTSEDEATGWRGGGVAGFDQREGLETEGTPKLSGPSASLLTLPPPE